MLLVACPILGRMTHHPLGAYEDAEVLIMAKTYPVQSQQYNELVCTAGLRIDTEPYTLIRLYPVPFRQLSPESQYSKWQVVRAKIRKREKDHRPESFGVDSDRIVTGEKIGTRNGWRERCSYLNSYLGQTDACTLLSNARKDKTAAQSLALVKPREITDVFLRINPEYEKARKEKPKQESVDTLFGPKLHPVYPSPVIFKYTYLCQSPNCRSHKQSVIDWEVQATAYKEWQKNGREGVEKTIRQKFIDHICSKDKDLWFFVGNAHKYPADFMILSFFYPDYGVVEQTQPMLFS